MTRYFRSLFAALRLLMAPMNTRRRLNPAGVIRRRGEARHRIPDLRFLTGRVAADGIFPLRDTAEMV